MIVKQMLILTLSACFLVFSASPAVLLRLVAHPALLAGFPCLACSAPKYSFVWSQAQREGISR